MAGNTISEPARELDVAAEADVVVVGGGPGGFPAAVAAARTGARVLLVERYGCLGGLATTGLVAPILAHTASRSATPIAEGLLRELTERMHTLDGAPGWAEACREWGIRFDAEALKRAADVMIQEAGVRLMLHAMVVGAVAEEGRIRALITESKSGRQAVVGRVFVDATGDADVAFRAGAPTRQGRGFDGAVESMGSFMHIGGLDGLTKEQRDDAQALVQSALEQGKLRFYNPAFTTTNSHHRDHFTPNMTRWPGDPTSVWDLTAAEMGVRGQAWELAEYLRRTVKGCEGAYLHSTSPQVGPRESRQIVGSSTLTGEDIRRGRKSPEAVARGSWWIDIHCPLGHTYPVHLCVRECPRGEACPFWAVEHEKGMRSRSELHPPQGDWYDIPYGCLVPEGIRNLLVAGRCISATHEGMAGARVMATCVAIGQAAGTAAATAVGAGCAPAEVKVPALRAALSAAGALV